MLTKLTKSNDGKSNQGFTIIETLIVLAIAGLILLIVFLAVPALERNSRNTQRKDDVSSLSGAIQEYVDNNGGGMPTVATNFTANWNPGFYTAGEVTLDPATLPITATYSGTQYNPASGSAIAVVEGGTCTTNGTALSDGTSTAQTASGVMLATTAAENSPVPTLKSVAILYDVEGSGGANGLVMQCTDAQ